MEKHFLADMMEGEGRSEFRAEPWYNPYGDCIDYKMADEAVVAERVDELLTVYNSAVDNRPIGFQIKGVQAIIRKLGLDGLAFASQAKAGAVKSISIAALLLAAYEEREPTLARRRAYAAAMEPAEKRSIPADQLQPA
ncbi:MAG: hypothetical protein WBD63_08900 [Phycisphaerae bacterium]|nr:hypothetical protein [Phycisphaerae bacterium]